MIKKSDANGLPLDLARPDSDARGSSPPPPRPDSDAQETSVHVSPNPQARHPQCQEHAELLYVAHISRPLAALIQANCMVHSAL